MVPVDIERASSTWTSVAPIVFVPRSEHEYERLVEVLDVLIDTVGEDEQHPLASMMDVIGTLIERYEDEHVPELTSPR
jgi:HTH-type transcriptional regulator / antitoxin HigA